MKLPKVSAGVDRFGVSRSTEENAGILPSRSWLRRRWEEVSDSINWCKARCATQSAAMVAACDAGTAGGGAIACHAVATAWGESCKNDC